MIIFLWVNWLLHWLEYTVFEFQPGLWVSSFIIKHGPAGVSQSIKPHSDYSLPKPHNTPLQNTQGVSKRER